VSLIDGYRRLSLVLHHHPVYTPDIFSLGFTMPSRMPSHRRAIRRTEPEPGDTERQVNVMRDRQVQVVRKPTRVVSEAFVEARKKLKAPRRPGPTQAPPVRVSSQLREDTFKGLQSRTLHSRKSLRGSQARRVNAHCVSYRSMVAGFGE